MTKIQELILFLGDILALILSFAAMLVIRFGSQYDETVVRLHSGPFGILFALWLIIFFVFNLYDFRQVNPNPRNIGRLAIAIGVGIIAGGLLFYLFPYFGIAPKIGLVITGAGAFIFLIIWRRIFYNIFSSFFSRAIVLVGESPELAHLAREIQENPHLGRVIAQIKEDALEKDPKQITKKVDLIIAEVHASQKLVTVAQILGSNVMTLIDAYQEFLGKIPVALMTEEHALAIASHRESYGYWLIRRLAENVIAGLVLLITSPFLLLAAIAKKIEDGGQIILRPHMRVGKNGKSFHFLKMRSMIINAEERGVVWAEKRDLRITKIGHIIRILHLDEIPQMVNILKGEMALVGPRPERPEFVEKLEKEIPYYFLRHTIKPGFTGWAQIKFRYARSVDDSRQKFEYDLYYIANRNILLDLGIILKTIQIIFTH